MKTFGITCTSLLLLGSVVAFLRYWLIMAVAVGFAGASGQPILSEARSSLLVGGAGMVLFLASALGYPLFSRRKYAPAIGLPSGRLAPGR